MNRRRSQPAPARKAMDGRRGEKRAERREKDEEKMKRQRKNRRKQRGDGYGSRSQTGKMAQHG